MVERQNWKRLVSKSCKSRDNAARPSHVGIDWEIILLEVIWLEDS